MNLVVNWGFLGWSVRQCFTEGVGINLGTRWRIIRKKAGR
jgi:hypothetical protein